MDPSGFPIRLDPSAAERHRASGVWSGVTLVDCAAQRAREMANAIAIVDGDYRLEFGTLWTKANRLAVALRERGLQPGDVISFQLPNWHETAIINLAAALGGYVCNPIVPIYRDAEVAFILRDARTKLIFVPASYRGYDYREMVERLRPHLPELRDVVVVRGGAGQFEALLEGPKSASYQPIDADSVKLLLYTSGTTGAPKGVLHSHNSLRAEIDAVSAFWKLRASDVMLMPSPVTHITGYLYGLELPFAVGLPVVLMERWNAEEAVELIRGEGVTVSVGATPFLVELVAAASSRNVSLDRMRLFACGGAPVPPDVVRRSRAILPNCSVCRIYGSSEAPTISLGLGDGDPPEFGATTDGRIVNHEVRIVDDAGRMLSPGEEGEILVRGPEVMLGYTSVEATRAAFDEAAFFRTGDLGVVEAGFITITGRKKDLIIRGGENISPKEIEDVLHRHPAVHEAAVVSMPHNRMGETPVAFVVLMPDASFDFADMTALLEDAQLARQKFPERLEIVDGLPRTAAGKVQKFVLARRIRDLLAEEQRAVR